MDTAVSGPSAPLPFRFLGSAGEYFRIWIVNVLLTVLTLGLYAPWAKVRKRRYFYGNTLLMNAPFDYLADPVAILKGRLVVLGVFALYYVTGIVQPAVQVLFLLVFIAAFPWIVIKAMAFNLGNTAYRNIRFRFDGDYTGALRVYLGLPLLSAVTVGLAYPLFLREKQKFLIENSAYGTAPFAPEASLGGFYKIFLKALGLAMIAGLLFFDLPFLMKPVLPSGQMGPEQQAAAMRFAFAMMLLTLPVLMILYGYIQTATTNYILNNTSLEGNRFESTLRVRDIYWLYFTNSLAIAFSLGLLIPWAAVRMARYRTSRLALLPTGDVDGFVAAEGEKVRAIGEELGDFLDLDIGL